MIYYKNKHINEIEFKQDIDKILLELKNINRNKIKNHFIKIRNIINCFYYIGVLTLFLDYKYVIPWLFLSIGIFGKWTMLQHHICHGGYDNIKSLKCNRKKYSIKSFKRRFIDWFDWISPEAWSLEHNNLHHYHLNESKDPDFVQNNFKIIRELNIPIFLKKCIVLLSMTIWKWFYYSPNTYKFYKLNRLSVYDKMNYLFISEKEKKSFMTIFSYVFKYCRYKWMNDLFSRIMLPYFLFMFILIPNIWNIIGYLMNQPDFYYNALINVIIITTMAVNTL